MLGMGDAPFPLASYVGRELILSVGLDRVTTPKKDAARRRCAGFNRLARHDAELFRSLMAGEHCLRGFTNGDIRARLASTVHLRACGKIAESKRQGQPYVSTLPRSRPDCQNPPNPSLAGHPLPRPRNGHLAIPA